MFLTVFYLFLDVGLIRVPLTLSKVVLHFNVTKFVQTRPTHLYLFSHL